MIFYYDAKCGSNLSKPDYQSVTHVSDDLSVATTEIQQWRGETDVLIN